MAAKGPPDNEDPGQLDPPIDQIGSDLDAEGEEETDIYQMDQQLQDAVHRSYSGEDKEDGEDDDYPDAEARDEYNGGEVRSNSAENEETAPVGAVKLPESENSSSEDEDADGDPAFEENERQASEHSESESEAEEEWEAESNGPEDDDAEADIRSRTNCIYCGQDEEHDPGEDFELWLTCTLIDNVAVNRMHFMTVKVRSDFKIATCGRAPTLTSELVDPWKCPTCVQNKLEPDPVEITKTEQKPGVPHLPKELLPAHAGKHGADFHSIFDTNLSEDLLNSSRSLRKRKASSIDVEEHTPVLRKRSRRTDNSEPNGKESSAVIADLPAEDEVSHSRPTRSRRPRGADREHARIVTRQPHKLIVSFRLDEGRPTTAKEKKAPKPPAVQPEPQAHFAPIPPAPYNSFTPFHDREGDDSKSKPYGGILSEADADTSRTLPLQADRDRFEAARLRAEEEWQRRVREAEANGEGSTAVSQKVSGPPSKIKYINFGGYEIETWYAAPYPEEYSRNRVLYICEFCLKYMNSDYVAWRHKLKCPAKHPPGDEIYRDGSISIFEVDGRKNPVYCQNLCLLAKLFLGSKTLYYDVEPFLFYVMTEYDDLGCHFVGYFSKEKRPSSANNVSCILTLPIHQRKGYGNLLIDFSYLLTRIEGKNGSPEKPLSDMGLVSYRNYWRLILSYQLRDLKTPLSIADLSDRTGMTADDIVSALEGLRALVRDPVTKTYAFRLDTKYFEEVIAKWENKGYVTLNPDALLWTPYIMGRSNQSQFDRAPLHAVAPRDDDEEDEEEAKADDEADGVPTLNGGHADGLGEPAGPPSTNGLQPNGVHASEGSGRTPSPPLLPLWPPVHIPVSHKRKTARPAAGKAGQTPTTVRTSGRNTPRRPSGLPAGTPLASTPSVRRGRSAKSAGSPMADGSPAKANGVEDLEQEEALVDDEEAVADQTLEEMALVAGGPSEAADSPKKTNGEDDPQEHAETNGIIHDDAFIDKEPSTPRKKSKSSSRSPGDASSHRSKGKQSDTQPKTPQSVSRKALVEKIQVVIPADPASESRHSSKKRVADTNGHDEDADAEGEDDPDVDAEYEVDGDVVMET
ncbi:hypothetical protein N7468_008568 [Penicillium chermesinum]|uniref:Histone acetyltransferase n=1 Tax=Penicillium chermesinum TaxID=63820 RepID=A0A9W9NPZ3_9EURO|nr:uncharacterized protein N7468_008568 [Penicillium chermesinum]KAJ5224026.1 hypothetical protein N7468_008568 [Penicillium chermesinum]